MCFEKKLLFLKIANTMSNLYNGTVFISTSPENLLFQSADHNKNNNKNNNDKLKMICLIEFHLSLSNNNHKLKFNNTTIIR